MRRPRQRRRACKRRRARCLPLRRSPYLRCRRVHYCYAPVGRSWLEELPSRPTPPPRCWRPESPIRRESVREPPLRRESGLQAPRCPSCCRPCWGLVLALVHHALANSRATASYLEGERSSSSPLRPGQAAEACSPSPPVHEHKRHLLRSFSPCAPSNRTAPPIFHNIRTNLGPHQSRPHGRLTMASPSRRQPS